jgi:hypothetical protein
MPTKKSNKKSTATRSKNKQSASKKASKKRASGPVAKAKKAVGVAITVAGESVTSAVKAVLPSNKGRKKSK